MELIQNNPYRVAGILSNATAKELEKQKGKIKAFAKVGKEIKSDFDFEILGHISRTEDTVNEAFSKIEQNQDKVSHSLFWFLNASPFDNTAIEYLKNGDWEKAIEIWEKTTTNKEVSPKNFSAFNNLGTYLLLSKDTDEIKKGIEAKIRLIESDYLKDFNNAVADETYTISNQKQIEGFVDALLTQFQKQYSGAKILQMFDACTEAVRQYLLKRLTEDPLRRIEGQIESCKKKRNADKRNANEFGLILFNGTKEDLSDIKLLLDSSNLNYKAIADQLANEILQCSIDYFNESQENDSDEDYLQQAIRLAKLSTSIAVGKLQKDRIKDNLATLEGMKDREINDAIAFLHSVKETYKTNEANIRREVKELEVTDMDLILGRKTINYSAVEVSIRNSINWDKVVELILAVIPKENINRIQNAQNALKINEFKSLVDFLFEKLNYSQKTQVKYLYYWKNVSVPPPSPQKIRPSSTSNTNTNWAKENPGCGLV
ncbi:MAG: tetratricopeptide repeat protein [Mangrovibacterium sp.]